jgi:hypothetical protein
MAGADSVIDVGGNSAEIFEYLIKALPPLDGEQRL